VTTEGMMIGALILMGVTLVGLCLYVVRSSRPRRPDSEPEDIGSRLENLRLALANRDGALETRVSQLDGRLGELQKDVAGKGAALDRQVASIDTRMSDITRLFTSDRARGGWGEIALLRILELGGLTEGRDYSAQFHSGNTKPDVVVHLPGDRRMVIDSKFPVARYLDALATDDPDDRADLLAQQGKELVRVGKELAARGYGDLAAGGCIVMYLPSQAVFELACAEHLTVIEDLLRVRVLVAGPTSLFSLLTVTGSLLAQHRGIRDADRILEEVREVNRRVSTWLGHLDRVGSALAGAVAAYNKAVGSWTSRVGPHLSRITAATADEESLELEPVEEAVRELPDDGLRVVV